MSEVNHHEAISKFPPSQALSAMTISNPATPPSIAPSVPPAIRPGLRSVISVLIFAHLFCAFVGLFAGFLPSPLGLRFLERMGPYTQVLCLDPRFAHPQLTMGSAEINRDFTNDVVFEIHLPDQDYTVPAPGAGQWTGTNRRYAELALAIAKAAETETENEATAAALSRGVALEAMNQGKSDRVTIEVVRWAAQSSILEPDEAADPNSSTYREVLYTVDVIRKTDGRVIVSKRSGSRETAPPILTEPPLNRQPTQDAPSSTNPRGETP